MSTFRREMRRRTIQPVSAFARRIVMLMIACDEVHVLWVVDSKGSHFDLGMAYALGKPIKAVAALKTGGPGKSYWKAVIEAADPNAAALAADAID